MHRPINVKSPNNISKWQMGFNSSFKGLRLYVAACMMLVMKLRTQELFNPLNAELNPICHLLALLGAHLILHISRIRVKMSTAVA